MTVMQSKIGVAVIDDQQLFRQSLAMLIRSVDNFELLAEAANGQGFLAMLPAIKDRINVILVDMDMPVMNGVELNKYIRQHCPGIRVIILSVHSEERIMSQMLNAGAAAYLAKNCDKDELITAIQTVHRTGYYVNQATLLALQMASQFKNDNKAGLLTPRELQVMQLICREFTNTEIAAQLFISVRTVEGHRNNLLTKTGCQTTAGLVIYAIKNKLVAV